MSDVDKIKPISHALRVISALDERTRQGQMDPKADATLKAAEATVSGCSGRLVLQAFRAWRDSGVSKFDPTGGYQRPVDERDTSEYSDMAMRSRHRR